MTYTKNLVSVIVPMYKVERFIGKCLRSILKQTYTQLEVIAVNDCSPDSTLSVVKEIAAKDKRVKIVDLKRNGGLSNARHEGYLVSTGEYIMHVDGDDYLPNHAVEALLDEIKRVDADIVEGGCNRVLDNLGLIKRTYNPEPLVANHDELMSKYFMSFFGVNILGVQMWGKLYRHDMVDKAGGMIPLKFMMGEDLISNLRIFPFVRRYSRIESSVYNYRWGGVTSSYNKTLYSDLKSQYYIKMKIAAEYKYEQAYKTIKIEMCNVLFSHLVQLMRFGYGRNEAKEFLEDEIANGFVPEITHDIEYSPLKFHLLKGLKAEELLNLSEKEANSKKWLRWIVKHVFSIIN